MISISRYLLAAISIFSVGCGGNSDDAQPALFVHQANAASINQTTVDGGARLELKLSQTGEQLSVYESEEAIAENPSGTIHQVDLERLWSQTGVDQVFEAELSFTSRETGARVSRSLVLSNPAEIAPDVFTYRVESIQGDEAQSAASILQIAATTGDGSVENGTDARLIVRDPFGAIPLASIPRFLVKTPALELATIAEMEFITNDKGTGAKMSYTAYRVDPPEGYFTLGSVFVRTQGGQPVEGPPRGLIIKAPLDTETDPILVPPELYTGIWNDKGSSSKRDSAFWRPVPPAGYTCVGMVITDNYFPPTDPDIRCVRNDLVTATLQGRMIYQDKGSGANRDVSVIEPVPNYGEIAIGLSNALANYDLFYLGPQAALSSVAQLEAITR